MGAVQNSPLMKALSAEAIRRICDLNPQNISNTALAYSMLGVRDDELMDSLAAAALIPEQRSKLNSHRISNESHRFAAHSLPCPMARPQFEVDDVRATAAFDMLFLLTLICYPYGTSFMDQG